MGSPAHARRWGPTCAPSAPHAPLPLLVVLHSLVLRRALSVVVEGLVTHGPVHLVVDGDATRARVHERPPGARVSVRALESHRTSGMVQLASLFEVTHAVFVHARGQRDIRHVCLRLRAVFTQAHTVVHVGIGAPTLTRGGWAGVRAPVLGPDVGPWAEAVVDVTSEAEPLLPRVWVETRLPRVLVRMVGNLETRRACVAWFAPLMRADEFAAYVAHHAAALRRVVERESKGKLHASVAMSECAVLSATRPVPRGKVPMLACVARVSDA